MRLPSFERGRLLRHQLFIALTRLLDAEIDDVVKTIMRRPVFFGLPFMHLAQAALRARSLWTVCERELFASVVSRANECPFCMGTHTAIAAYELGPDPLGWLEEARSGARVTAACRFVEKLTREPESIGDEDVASARAAGVEDRALLEAIYVTCLFNMINRVANALEFTHPSETSRRRGASILRRLGYRLPGVLLQKEPLP